MDEVSFLVTLLEEKWDEAVTALGSEIPAIHRVHPQIMDIRDMSSTRNTAKPGRGGNRVRISKATESESGGVTNSTDLLVVRVNLKLVEYKSFSIGSIGSEPESKPINENKFVAPPNVPLILLELIPPFISRVTG